MMIEICLKGTSPLLMHNPQMVDPDFPLNREIKAITSKRKKTDDDNQKIERLEWYGSLYTEQNGHGLSIVYPTANIRKCLVETAKISKLGKALGRVLSFQSMNVSLVYDGPNDVDDLFKLKQFHSRLSVGISGKRVMRVRPRFMPWALTVPGFFVEDAGMNFDELERIVELAGIVEGVGDNRINGHGRFMATVKKTK